MTSETYGPRTSAWQSLVAHSETLKSQSIDTFFRAHQDRFGQFSLQCEDLLLDYSRQFIDEQAFSLLLELAEQTGVEKWIQQMFSGENINSTENRPALHVALRRPSDQHLILNDQDLMPLVQAERERMRIFVEMLSAGELKGFSGKSIIDVVNIGIGGSDLGVAMATFALTEYRLPSVNVHFVSNIDGIQLTQILSQVDPETTLFVVCSKSFSTLETLSNAITARRWLEASKGGQQAVTKQFVGVSSNHEALDSFGVAREMQFSTWDWVGGRYSIWSSMGISLALAIGWEHFEIMLNGAHAMDQHFSTTPSADNLPVVLALLGIWNRNMLCASGHAILPYDYHLRWLPTYLQQLEMESNGKSIRRNGEAVECKTCPIIWGELGSNAQHSFAQFINQGTELISIDFIMPARSGVGCQDQRDLAVLSGLAQAWIPAVEDSENFDQKAHERCHKNRPNSLLIFPELNPSILGKLLALYEHKVFVQSIIWDINPFDQWGVQLGKRLFSDLEQSLSEDQAEPTPIAGALKQLRIWKGK